jgi:hypothetical protein
VREPIRPLTTGSNSSKAILETIEAAWRPMRDAATRLGEQGLESRTSAGWTAKELLAHVAFWDEAVVAVVVGMFRRQPLPDGWTFGSGYLPGDGESWPPADVHNAREASWAQGRSAAEVLARLDHAHDRMVSALSTVTDQEASEHGDYFDRLPRHYVEHLPELQELRAPGS